MHCAADDRQALEQLCRHITRPALANEGVQTNAAGQVVLKLKTPWRDGTTHLVMSPLEFMQRLAALEFMQRLAALEFMQRLAALVPRSRLHLTAFTACWHPHLRLRPSSARRWCRKSLRRPRRKQRPPSAKRTARITARCG